MGQRLDVTLCVLRGFLYGVGGKGKGERTRFGPTAKTYMATEREITTWVEKKDS
jgi:hypothetical protein